MNPLQIGDLKIPVPLIQGGMGIGISLSRLASAVANSGGVGVIASVGLGLIHGSPGKSFRENNREALMKEIRKARELTQGVLGVNIMTVLTNFGELVKTALEEGIDIIFSGAGLPLDMPQYLKPGQKTKLVPIVSSGRAANILIQKWQANYNYLPDAFVVEGPEAGGHLGFKQNHLGDPAYQLKNIVAETVKVVREAADKFKKNIPVIAAGGIMTGKQIFSIMQAGASAVQMGSRFVTTEECDASEAFKQALLDSKKENIDIIKSPVGLPGRAISNDFLNRMESDGQKPEGCAYHCIKSCHPKTNRYCMANALLAAYQGRLEKGFAFSGARAYQLKKITTVPELFRELKAGYRNEKQKREGSSASA